MIYKSEDYKISAVKYYLNNKDNIRKTCKIFDCKKSTLQRWIQRYKTSKNLTRRNRKNHSIILIMFLSIEHIEKMYLCIR
jgi:transposase-like protein